MFYEPFGQPRDTCRALTGNVAYTFTDQEWDAETGLYNYDARLYDAMMGRFLSADSVIPDYYNPQALDRYAYVLNNPLGLVDPTGHDYTSWKNSNFQYPDYARSGQFYVMEARYLSPSEGIVRWFIHNGIFAPCYNTVAGTMNLALKANQQPGNLSELDLLALTLLMPEAKPAIEGAAHGVRAAVKKVKLLKGASKRVASFADEAKLLGHFENHGAEFGVKTADDYLNVGHDIMEQGIKVNYLYKGETRTGFVKFMGNTRKGNAKFGFVGTNTEGHITTIHIESGKSFWKMLNGNSEKVIKGVQ